MEKNNQPLILGIVVIGAVLIIALALIFTRSSDDTATETADENNISENQENENTEENGEDNQQHPPDPVPQPTPQPTPAPTPVPNPQPDVLSVWDSLSVQEKTDLNPFDCDHETQWVSAEDGSCINKQGEQPISSCTALIPECGYHEPNLIPEYILLTESRDCDEPTDFLGEMVQRCEIEVAIAVKGEPTDEALDAYWTAWEREKAFSWHGGGIVSLVFYEHNGSESIGDYTDTDLLKEYSEDYLID